MSWRKTAGQRRQSCGWWKSYKSYVGNIKNINSRVEKKMATIKARSVGTQRRRSGAAESAVVGFWVRLGVLVQIIALLAGVFCLFSYRVSLGDKLTQTARETARVKQSIHELDREIEALRIKKEVYSDWEYISRQIEHYNLGLRPAGPSQRYSLILKNPSPRLHRVETAAR